jgi:YidC/Oxa1 family membrane protein insertase
MDFRRMVLFLGLSVLCMYLYSQAVYRIYGPTMGRPGVESMPAEPEPAVAEAEPEMPAGTAARPTDVPPGRPGRSITVDTDLYRAEWTTSGGRLRGLHLKRYRSTLAQDSPGLDLVVVGSGQQMPLGLELSAIGFNDAGIVYEADQTTTLSLSGRTEDKIVFHTRTATGIEVYKEVRFRGDAYPMQVLVRAEGAGAESANNATLRITHEISPDAAVKGGGWFGGGSTQNGFHGIVALNGKRLEQKAFSDLEEPVIFPAAHWAGFGDQYFITVGLTQRPDGTRAEAAGEPARHLATVDIDLPLEGSPRQAELMLYFGPKDIDILKSAAPSLGRAVDFGIFWFVALPLLQLLKALHRISGNYGVDIIVLSTLIKVLFLPLTKKSMVSMQEMQKLQPQMAKIRERYKDDAQRQQKEMMELYKRHHVNPLSGCLPMLLQLPMFVGLYNALLNSIELRHAPFVGWITDLSAPERLAVMGFNIPMLAIAMGASMLVQQMMTPATGDPAQRRIMMIMPVIFTFMFINFPSGLVLYWLVNNLLTIAQQYFLVNRTAG